MPRALHLPSPLYQAFLAQKQEQKYTSKMYYYYFAHTSRHATVTDFCTHFLYAQSNGIFRFHAAIVIFFRYVFSMVNLIIFVSLYLSYFILLDVCGTFSRAFGTWFVREAFGSCVTLC
jgi:hypothetical protein